MELPERELKCLNNREHIPHRYQFDIEVPCNGITECGEQAHPAHIRIDHDNLYCRGVCYCKVINYKHDAADHLGVT